MRRIVCVVEGHGDVEAAPVLCHRVLRTLLGVRSGWHVDESPIRVPRGLLVSTATRGVKSGTPNHAGLARTLAIAVARNPDAVLIVCDADDDCPASFGPAVPDSLSLNDRAIPVRGVMASREFESWLLCGFDESARKRVFARQPDVAPRNAKKALQRLVPGYSPSTHQAPQVRATDWSLVHARSRSFRRFVDCVADLVGIDRTI